MQAHALRTTNAAAQKAHWRNTCGNNHHSRDRGITGFEPRADRCRPSGAIADGDATRADLIAEHAVFQKDDDAVPVAGTVATVFAINANGVVTKSDANLVGDNYWGIANVLGR